VCGEGAMKCIALTTCNHHHHHLLFKKMCSHCDLLPSSPFFGHAYALPFMIFIGCCHLGILFPLCGILVCKERAMKYMKLLQLAIIIIIVFFLCEHTHLLSPSIVQVCWHSHFSLAFVILVLILQNHGFYTNSIMF
jgi:hypothetical protein